MSRVWRPRNQSRKSRHRQSHPSPDRPFDGRVDLPTRRCFPREPQRSRFPRTPRGADGLCQAGWLCCARLVGIGRHQVEDGPDLLCLAANHVAPGGRDVGVVHSTSRPSRSSMASFAVFSLSSQGAAGAVPRWCCGCVRTLSQTAGGVVAPGVIVIGNTQGRLRSRG